MPRCGRFHSVLLLLVLSGCGVHYGFSKGAFPSDIKTMAVLPFDNATASPDVQSELYDAMRDHLGRRLGVKPAPESKADAVVQGKITTYDADIPVSFSGNQTQAVSARRKVQITISVEILDRHTGRPLWKSAAVTASADYAERAEADGRSQAIDKLIDQIVDGAQSQW